VGRLGKSSGFAIPTDVGSERTTLKISFVITFELN